MSDAGVYRLTPQPPSRSQTLSRRRDNQASDADHRTLIAAARAQVEGVRAGSSANGAGPSDPAPPHPELRKYRLVRELHRGGQGVVYLAEQRSPHRQVALKMVRQGPLATRDEQERFRREIETLGSISHPNIVSIHDSGADAGYLYYVMDYVEGAPLDEFVQPRRERAVAAGSRRQVREFIRETLALFAKVCDAVQAAHLRGVIHRDLKPSNIRVDERSEPRVLDFGLAKLAAAEHPSSAAYALTEAGQFLGTLAYASPEQAEGNAADLDLRTDVYSLGVLLYQLLTGRMPYDVAGRLSDVLRAIQECEPQRPSWYVPETRGDVETILLTCLQKSPGRRYQTADALAADIRRCLAGEPIDARRDSPGYVLRRQLAKHRLPVAAAAVVMALIVIGLVVSLSLWRSAVDQERRARREAAKAQAFGDFLHEALASASPYRRPGEPVQVREVLEDAQRRLDAGAFADQPDVEAGLRTTVGMSYRALGRGDDALRELAKALSLRQSVLPAGHSALAESHHNLGRACFDAGDYDRAATHLQRAVATWEANEHAADHHEGMAEAEYWLAMIEQNSGRIPEARPRFLRALALLGESGSARLRALCLESLSVAAGQLGDPQRAVELAGQAVAIQRQAFGEHPYLISSLNVLGSRLLMVMRYADAIDVYREATDLSRRFLGSHPELAYALLRLGRCRYEMEEHEAALATFEEALSILREFFGADDMRVLAARSHCGSTLRRLGRLEQAAEIEREVIQTRRRLGHRLDLAAMLVNYAETLAGLRRPDEAEGALREALEIQRACFAEGKGRNELPEVLSRLAVLLIARGRTEEAEPLMREALDLRLEYTNPGGSVLATARRALAECARARGDFTEAERMLLQAVDDLESVPSRMLDFADTRIAVFDGLASLYAAWSEVDPDAGHDESAALWSARLAALEAAPAETSP